MNGPHWYVAFVRSCQERKVAERLGDQGFETYVPTLKKVHQYPSGRKRTIYTIIFPRMVFIRCDEKRRRDTFDMVYGITGYMMDKSSQENRVLIVPDSQMETFVLVVNSRNDNGSISVVTDFIEKGDTVQVLTGPLEGLVCECVEIRNKHHLVIRLDNLGSVLVDISAQSVRKV